MTTTRVSTGFDGTSYSEEMPSAGKTQRSTDFVEEGGVEFRQGPAGFKTTAWSEDMIGDNDLITIGGMEVTGKMARELGLLSRVFDEGLSSGAAARAALQDKQSAHRTPQEKALDALRSIPADTPAGADTTVDTDTTVDAENSAYAETSKGLREAVESGTMSADEAVIYDAMAAEMAMTEIDVLDVAELQRGLHTGEIDQQDVDPDVKQTLERFEQQVTDAARKAVTEEIGQEGFHFIQRAAQSSPEVDSAVRDFAVMRATGRANGLTWSDFLQDVRDHRGYA